MSKELRITALVLAFAAIAPAQNLEIVSESMFHGSYYTIAVAGNYAYFAGHEHLLALSFQNPLLPEITAVRQFDSGTTSAVKYGNYIYFTGAGNISSYSVAIVDISTPGDPQITATFGTHTRANDILVDSDRAFVADESGQLLIADVTDPANPFAISRLETGAQSQALALYGNYLYIAEYDSTLSVVDIFDIDNPAFIGRVIQDTGGAHNSSDILVKGDYLFIADVYAGLRVFSISNPVMPEFIAALSPNDHGIDEIALLGDTLFGISSWDSLYAIDVTFPSQPAILGRFGTENENPRRLATCDSSLYLLGNNDYGWYGYVYKLDVTTPSNIYPTSLYRGCSILPNEIELRGNNAYVGSNGIETWDIPDPARPTKIGEFSVAIRDLTIAGDVAYAIIDSNRLAVIDVTRPESLSIISTISFNYTPEYFVGSGHYLYLKTGTPGFYIINVSDPHSPEVVRFFNDGASIGGVTWAGNYLYITGSALAIYDVSDPVNPVRISSYTLPRSGSAISVSGDYAYIKTSYPSWIDELMVVNVADRTAPIYCSSLTTTENVQSIHIDGFYAFLIESGNYIEVVDITNPPSPFIVTGKDISGDGADAVIRDGYLYLAADRSFVIMRATGLSSVNEPPLKTGKLIKLECGPNPSNSTFSLSYELSEANDILIEIFDITGRLIKSYPLDHEAQGFHRVEWNAASASSGLYFAKITAGSISDCQTIVLLK